MAHERRKHERVPVDILTQIECRADRRNCLAHATDISVGGLSLITPLVLDCGTRIDLRLNLFPGAPGSLVETVGTVIHSDPVRRRMGIQFDSLEPDQEQRLANFVAAQREMAASGNWA